MINKIWLWFERILWSWTISVPSPWCWLIPLILLLIIIILIVRELVKKYNKKKNEQTKNDKTVAINK